MSEETGAPGEPAGEEGELIIARVDEEKTDGPEETIDQPAKLLRIASMVQRMLNEVRDVDLDKASRKRLTDMYNRTIEELADILPGDLQEELSVMVIQILATDDPPTQAELRVVHAQLVGWLEGLFHGIQASIASQQLALQDQLARMRKQHALKQGGAPDQRGDVGQYL